MARNKLTPEMEASKFKPGQSGNPKGRPRKMTAQVEQLMGMEFNIKMSKDTRSEILESMLEMSITDLTKIANDKNAPALIVIIAKGLCEDAKNGKMTTISELFDRLFGKPKQAVNVEVPEHTAFRLEVVNFVQPVQSEEAIADVE